VLLVNHGSPDATDVRSVRRYLRSFLSDPRLIELPRVLWLMILHGIILRVRPCRTAKAYRKIWTSEGSPMQVISASLVEQVRERCAANWGSQVVVAGGNTYGIPSIGAGLEELRRADAQRIIVVPLYPQYTGVTVGSVFDRVAEELTSWRWVPELRFVSGYHDNEKYLAAIAESISDFRRVNGAGDKLLLSFHSLPVAYVEAGDPYFCICSKSARRIAGLLGLGSDEWMLSFQSTFVGGNWLKPDLEELLPDLKAAGHKKLDVICPGFAVDNLETLEEIVERYAADFAADGEGELRFIPCLNAEPAQVDIIEDLIRRNLGGWEDLLRPVSAVPTVPQELSVRASASN
jgi:ferrochelatase